eukprot:5085205-Prymnesium_polylepis.1
MPWSNYLHRLTSVPRVSVDNWCARASKRHAHARSEHASPRSAPLLNSRPRTAILPQPPVAM